MIVFSCHARICFSVQDKDCLEQDLSRFPRRNHRQHSNTEGINVKIHLAIGAYTQPKLPQSCWKLLILPTYCKLSTSCSKLVNFMNKGGFSFFPQEGWKNFRWGASHMQYAILAASGRA